jgi:hypothetical protein
MVIRFQTADEGHAVRLRRQPRGATSSLERTLFDPDFRPLLFVLTISGLAAIIATAIRAL